MTVERAAELRRAFDEGFARPPATARETGEIVLAIRAGTDVAVRIGELVEIVPLGTVVPLPDARVFGIAGVRGQVVPVWRLADLLHATTAAPERWLALVHTPAGLAGIAFTDLIGHFNVEIIDLVARLPDDRLLPIVSFASLLKDA